MPYEHLEKLTTSNQKGRHDFNLLSIKQGYIHHKVKCQYLLHHLNDRKDPPQTHGDQGIFCIYKIQISLYYYKLKSLHVQYSLSTQP